MKLKEPNQTSKIVTVLVINLINYHISDATSDHDDVVVKLV